MMYIIDTLLLLCMHVFIIFIFLRGCVCVCVCVCFCVCEEGEQAVYTPALKTSQCWLFVLQLAGVLDTYTIN